jgi:hypothetical protein
MPPEAEIKAQLEKILNSKLFLQKRALRRVLRHVVEAVLKGQGGALTQKTIAQDLLKKPADFTGDKDSSVRGHMLRLRTALAEYYAAEGKYDLILIQLDHGPGYAPSIEYRMPAPAESAAGAVQQLPVVTPEQTPLRYTINVRADAKDIETVLGNAHRLVQNAPPGSIINFEFASVSSLLLHLRCSLAGLSWLEMLWQRGELSAWLGFPVTALLPTEVLNTELREQGKPVARRCVSSIPVRVNRYETPESIIY